LEPAQYGNLVSQIRGSTTSYGHFDGLGSTDRLTDGNANVTDNYTYFAFGAIKASTVTTTNPFRYVGRLGYYYDPDNAEYYVRARQYDPASGRFLSHDPWGYGSADGNLYTYVKNSPLHRADPGGLQPFPFPIGPIGILPLLLLCRTQSTTRDDCGKFDWTVEFSLSWPTKRGGAFVQELTRKGYFYDCKTKKETFIELPTCWEASLVGKDKNEIGTDSFGYKEEEPCQKGYHQFTGRAYFIEGLGKEDLTGRFKFVPGENLDCPGLGPYSTKVRPNLPARSTNTVIHNLLATWNCCEKPMNTVIVAAVCR
jgi:RHS repeat-associated protein